MNKLRKIKSLVLCAALLTGLLSGVLNVTTVRADYFGDKVIRVGTDKYIYDGHGEEKTTTVKGISYSKKTNTLTIKNYANKNKDGIYDYIEVYGMGKDFKVVLKGKSKLYSLNVSNGSLEIAGSSSLNLVPEDYYGSTEGGNIEVSGGNEKGTYSNVFLKIGKKCNIKAERGIEVYTKYAKKSKALVLKGKTSGKIKKEKWETTNGKTVYTYQAEKFTSKKK